MSKLICLIPLLVITGAVSLFAEVMTIAGGDVSVRVTDTGGGTGGGAGGTGSIGGGAGGESWRMTQVVESGTPPVSQNLTVMESGYFSLANMVTKEVYDGQYDEDWTTRDTIATSFSIGSFASTYCTYIAGDLLVEQYTFGDPASTSGFVVLAFRIGNEGTVDLPQMVPTVWLDLDANETPGDEVAYDSATGLVSLWDTNRSVYCGAVMLSGSPSNVILDKEFPKDDDAETTLITAGGTGSQTLTVSDAIVSLSGAMTDMKAGTNFLFAVALCSGSDATELQTAATDAQTAWDGQIEPVLSGGTQPLLITNTSLADGTVGDAYGVVLDATGGDGSYTWSQVGLPSGINLSGNRLDGIPDPGTEGDHLVTITVQDGSSLSAQQVFTLTILPDATAGLAITVYSLADATVGQSYGPVQLAAANSSGNLTWTVQGLPAGLVQNTDLVEGVPDTGTEGQHSVTISVTDSNGSDSTTLTLEVLAAATGPLTITTAVLTDATVGEAYTLYLSASGGDGNYTWTVSGLPGGLQHSAGLISGTPIAVGTDTVTITVTDSTSPTPETHQVQLGLTVLPEDLANVLGQAVGSGGCAVVAGSGDHVWLWVALATGCLLAVRVRRRAA